MIITIFAYVCNVNDPEHLIFSYQGWTMLTLKRMF